MAKKKWIQGAVKKPGALRSRLKALGLVKGEERIPVSVLKRAAAGEFGPKTALRARFALNVQGLNKRR